MAKGIKQFILKGLEITANLAIIVIASLLFVVLVRNYQLSKSVPMAEGEVADTRSQLATKLSIPGIEWAKNGRTLLLVLSTSCHFCSESAPFYQRLFKERGSNIRFVAVMAEPISAGRDYLNGAGISVDDVRQTTLNSIGVRGTPTLMIVDNRGVVTDMWVGKLPNTEEASVLNQVHQNTVQK